MDIEMLRHTAAKTGLGLNYISKDEKLSYLLTQLGEIFPEDVVLKGGTAINRVYLAKIGVSRFSEDIDLDFLIKGDLNGRIESIKAGMKKVMDFDVRGPRILHRTLRFDCYYLNELGYRDRVKAEFYLSAGRYISYSKELIKSPFLPYYPALFNIYSFEDLMAKKLMALHNRTEGKDIYDSFHLLNMDFDRKRLMEALSFGIEFYHIEGDFFESLNERLERALRMAAYIGNSTNHFIPRSLRPNWREMIRTVMWRIEGMRD